jgi:hypothetical protein
MKPLEVKTKDGTFTQNIGSVINILSVKDVQDTILDPEIIKKGATVQLPIKVEGIYGSIERIILPPSPPYREDDFVIIDNISSRFNNILRVIELVKKGERSLPDLQKSVTRYQKEIILTISGKNGILSRDIIGSRMQLSGRAVLLPSNNPDPELVFIPLNIFKKLGLSNGDLVIVGRDPTIWEGSIEILRARSTIDYSIYVHPAVFSQFGADCDGDTVWVLKVPDNELAQKEASENILSFCRSHIDQTGIIGPKDRIFVDSANLGKIYKSMSEVSGFSISPEDIINNSPDIETFKDNTHKNVRDECHKILTGLSVKDFSDYILSINNAMLAQKIYLGPIGAASIKIKILSKDPIIVRSANYVSERAQQLLFDVKGVVKGSSKELQNFFVLLDILNIRGRFKSTSNRIVSSEIPLKSLEDIGLSVEKSAPIIRYLYTAYPILSSFYCDEETVKILREYCCSYNECRDYVKDVYLSLLNSVPNLTTDEFYNTYSSAKMNLALSHIVNDPIYSVTNPFSLKKLEEDILSVHNNLKKKWKNRLTAELLAFAGEDSYA